MMTVWHWAAIGGGALIAAGLILLIVYLVLARKRDVMRSLRKGQAANQAAWNRDLRNMLAELQDLALRVDRRLNGRMERLSELIDQADRTIHRLEQRCQPGPEALGSHGHRDPACKRVLTLAGQGLDPVEIARRMEMDVGEVQLVLQLQETGRAGD
jgi:hypothetical protein